MLSGQLFGVVTTQTMQEAVAFEPNLFQPKMFSSRSFEESRSMGKVCSITAVV